MRTGNRSLNPNVKDPEQKSYQSTMKALSKIDKYKYCNKTSQHLLHFAKTHRYGKTGEIFKLDCQIMHTNKSLICTDDTCYKLIYTEFLLHSVNMLQHFIPVATSHYRRISKHLCPFKSAFTFDHCVKKSLIHIRIAGRHGSSKSLQAVKRVNAA